jgi:hypothetical protein
MTARKPFTFHEMSFTAESLAAGEQRTTFSLGLRDPTL